MIVVSYSNLLSRSQLLRQDLVVNRYGFLELLFVACREHCGVFDVIRVVVVTVTLHRCGGHADRLYSTQSTHLQPVNFIWQGDVMSVYLNNGDTYKSNYAEFCYMYNWSFLTCINLNQFEFLI